MLAVMPSTEMESAIKQRLLQLLVNSKKLIEPSMYIGSGFAWMLIKGKIANGDYSFVDEIVQQVNELGTRGYYIRTFTYLATGSGEPFTTEQESLGKSDSHLERSAVEPIDLEKLLAGIENDKLEVKGSLQLNIERYVYENHHPTEFEERIATEGVLKAVVGFMNSQGGHIVIGALERQRYEKFTTKEGHPLHGKPILVSLCQTTNMFSTIISTRPVAAFRSPLGSGFAGLGEWILMGVETEIEKRSKNIDGYIVLLASLIKDRIGGDASALVAIEPVMFQGKIPIVVIKVPKSSKWFYLDKDGFFVRGSGSTIPLNGREREDYQKTPRG